MVRAVLRVLLCVLPVAAACSGPATGSDSGLDAFVADVTPVLDVAEASACPTGGVPSFVAQDMVETFALDCSGEAGTDGFVFAGTVVLTNTGTTAIESLVADRAQVTDLAGFAAVLTVPIEPITVDRICPGQTRMLTVRRSAGASSPSMPCSVLTCGAGYRIRVPLAATRLPSGASAPSEPSVLACGR